jgi:hypothetical protein
MEHAVFNLDTLVLGEMRQHEVDCWHAQDGVWERLTLRDIPSQEVPTLNIGSMGFALQDA